MGEVNTNQKKGGHSGLNGCKKLSTRVDMTPVVDLAFLLLTFFMLATTFIKPQVMELVLPEKIKENESQPMINENKALSIVLFGDNKIYWYIGLTDPKVQETDYSSTGIRKVLQDQSRLIDKLYVLVKPDVTSNYENLIDILDELEITATKRYALVDIGVEDQQLIKKYAAMGNVQPLGVNPGGRGQPQG